MKKLSFKNSDNLTVDEAFEDFKGHCRIKNLSGETIKLYQYQFNVFHRFLDNETYLISDITLATVNSFILELRSDKHVCNDVTVNTYLRQRYQLIQRNAPFPTFYLSKIGGRDIDFFRQTLLCFSKPQAFFPYPFSQKFIIQNITSFLKTIS